MNTPKLLATPWPSYCGGAVMFNVEPKRYINLVAPSERARRGHQALIIAKNKRMENNFVDRLREMYSCETDVYTIHYGKRRVVLMSGGQTRERLPPRIARGRPTAAWETYEQCRTDIIAGVVFMSHIQVGAVRNSSGLWLASTQEEMLDHTNRIIVASRLGTSNALGVLCDNQVLSSRVVDTRRYICEHLRPNRKAVKAGESFVVTKGVNGIIIPTCYINPNTRSRMMFMFVSKCDMLLETRTL
jgi:hypothetical protein